MGKKKGESGVCPQRLWVGILHHSPSSSLPVCQLFSRCHIHEIWFPTQINTAAGWMLSGPKLERVKKKKKRLDTWGWKKYLPVVSFLSIFCELIIYFFALKKTAGWRVVHLGLKLLGKEMHVWTSHSVQWFNCLCLDTGWQKRAQKW